MKFVWAKAGKSAVPHKIKGAAPSSGMEFYLFLGLLNIAPARWMPWKLLKVCYDFVILMK